MAGRLSLQAHLAMNNGFAGCGGVQKRSVGLHLV